MLTTSGMWWILFVYIYFASLAQCRIFDYETHHDTSQSIVIKTFGHTTRGVLNITVTRFELHVPKKIEDKGTSRYVTVKSDMANNVGFIYKRVTSTESAHHESYFRGLFIHNQNERTCFENLRASIRAMDQDAIIIPISKIQLNVANIIRVPNGKRGLYGLFYYNCEQKKDIVVVPASLRAHVEQYNEGSKLTKNKNPARDYLTVGESPLSLIYTTISGCFLFMTIACTLYIIKQRNDVYKIHFLMVLLTFLKSASLFFEGARYHYLQMNGVALEWSVMYYVFTFFKGVMMFIVVLLLATGWSFIKSFLTSLEKTILVGVLSLQVFSNVGTVVLEASENSSSTVNTWRQVLNWVDLVCIVLVLPVISWSIRNLKNASTADGKAIQNAIRLSQFQLLYIVVFGYSYFTRILGTFMKTKLNHNFVWMPDLINEVLTLIVFIFTGYQFRPIKIQEYMEDHQEPDDDDIDEEGRGRKRRGNKGRLRGIIEDPQVSTNHQPPVFGWVYSVVEYLFLRFKKIID